MPIRRLAPIAAGCWTVLGVLGDPACAQPTEAGAATGGTASRTPEERFGGALSVKDCGAGPQASASQNLAAFQACILAAGGQVIVPGPGLYHLSGGLSIAGATGAAALVGVGRPTLEFDSLNAATDAITVIGANYRPSLLQRLDIDLKGSGQDGVVIEAGSHPVVSGVNIRNAGRDNLVAFTTGYGWVQNALFSNILLTNAGRHAIRLETAGSNGAYVNEIDLQDIEIRGVGPHGNPIYAKAGGAKAGSQISRVTGSITIDFQNKAAAPADPAFIRFAATPGGANAYASWHITGGGWEDTGAGFAGDGRAPLAVAEPGATVSGLTIEGVVPGGHVSPSTANIAPVKIEVSPRNAAQISLAAGFSAPSLLVNADAMSPSAASIWLCRQGPSASSRDNMPGSVCLNGAKPTDQDDGVAVGGAREFRSGPLAANTAGQAVTVKKVVRPAIGAYADDVRTLKVDLQSWQYDGSGAVFQREYLLMIAPSGKVQALQVADGSSANLIGAVAFSVSGQDLVMTLTTGAGWAAGGGSSILHGAVFEPLFVP